MGSKNCYRYYVKKHFKVKLVRINIEGKLNGIIDNEPYLVPKSIMPDRL